MRSTHRQPSRPIVPIALGIIGLLGLVLLGIAAQNISAVAVPGMAVAEAGNWPVTVPYQDSGVVQADMPGQAPTSAPVPPPAPPATAPNKATPPPPAAPRGQQPGTIRLARGGSATLVRKEVGPDRVLPVPENLREATWWGAGLNATTGATVMAGHVNLQGATGPFAELWDAKVGDQVSVVDAVGKTWRYRVSRIVTVNKDQLPAQAEELFGQGGAHRLVLVTCGGRWIGGDMGYASNQIVIAEPVS